jgi:resuscitation-promoting factor RpfA
MSGTTSPDSIAQFVKNYETGGGDYTATNPASTASGAYQFTNPTWLQYAPQAGVDTGLYPTAASAPPALQDAVFQQAYQTRGLADWTCPGCDAPLTAAYNANPSAVTSLPVLASTDPGFGGSSGSGVEEPSIDVGPTYNPSLPAGTPGSEYTPGGSTTQSGTTTGAAGAGALPSGTGTPVSVGLQPSATGIVSSLETAVGNWMSNAAATLFGSIENAALRMFLFIIAIVLLAIGLWKAMDPDGTKTKAALRTVAIAA